jgi:hypothetical protein
MGAWCGFQRVSVAHGLRLGSPFEVNITVQHPVLQHHNFRGNIKGQIALIEVM